MENAIFMSENPHYHPMLETLFDDDDDDEHLVPSLVIPTLKSSVDVVTKLTPPQRLSCSSDDGPSSLKSVSKSLKYSKKTLKAKAPTKTKEAPNEPLRKGCWSAEEEAYVQVLMENFLGGSLRIETGTTLRTFLSRKLNCNPMRISKKYAANSKIGKICYAPQEVPESKLEDTEEILKYYQKQFLDSVPKKGKRYVIPEDSTRARDAKTIRAPTGKIVESSSDFLLGEVLEKEPYGNGTGWNILEKPLYWQMPPVHPPPYFVQQQTYLQYSSGYPQLLPPPTPMAMPQQLQSSDVQYPHVPTFQSMLNL